MNTLFMVGYLTLKTTNDMVRELERVLDTQDNQQCGSGVGNYPLECNNKIVIRSICDFFVNDRFMLVHLPRAFLNQAR